MEQWHEAENQACIDAPESLLSPLCQILNPVHPLVNLANRIDWQRLQLALEDAYCEDFGAPAKAVRLMAGLLYLKHAMNLSDEALLERWVENPYWQYLCDFESMPHETPIYATSLTKWRNRLGAERLGLLLTGTIDLAVREKQLNPQQLAQVTVDTTVQEKNISYPTDSKLYFKAIVKLAKGRCLSRSQAATNLCSSSQTCSHQCQSLRACQTAQADASAAMQTTNLAWPSPARLSPASAPARLAIRATPLAV
ncbi:MAG: transposase [Pirellulaceae bacterium]|nr:transposase [Pirellulaceae bacterium]